MTTIQSFEEMEVWQKARELTREIYAASGAAIFSGDFVLRDQMRRAAVSIMSNIAEGFERGGRGEFVQFLAIAKGSAGEIKSQLYIAHDQGYVTPQDFVKLTSLVSEIGKMLGGLINYLRKSGIKGAKYK